MIEIRYRRNTAVVAGAGAAMLVLATLTVTSTLVAAPAAAAPATASPAPVHRSAAPAVHPDARRVAPLATTCSASVTAGSTSTCTFAGAGKALYRIALPAGGTLRVRAAAPGASAAPQVTVRTNGQPVSCINDGSGQLECPVDAAGTYTAQVVVGEATKAYTTLDSARHTASCASSLDLTVGAPGAPVSVANPGASWCTKLPTAQIGDVLQFVLHSNSDIGLNIRIYDDTGVLRCGLFVTAFARPECTLDHGAGFRMFAAFDVDTAASTTLVAARLSRPSGCATGDPDAFFAAPSRSGTVAAASTDCFSVHLPAGGVLLADVTPSTPSVPVQWSIRNAAGEVVCGSADGQVIERCSAPDPGTYTLFVFSPVRADAGYVAGLAALDSPGCTSGPTTAYGAAPADGRVSQAGTLGCAGFTTPGDDVVRVTLWDGDNAATGAVFDANGALVCRVAGRADCATDGVAPYRVVVASSHAVDYHLWLTDLDSLQGCAPTKADAFESAPSRSANIDATHNSACWRVTLPAASTYLLRPVVSAGGVLPRVELREPGGATRCTLIPGAAMACPVHQAGPYLLVVTPYGDHYQAGQTGSVQVGLWRLDQSGSCPSTSKSFAHEAYQASLTAPGQVNCARVSGVAGTVLLLRSASEVPLENRVYAANGALECVVYGAGTCVTKHAGPFAVVTMARDGVGVGAYTLRIGSVSPATGCPERAASPFGIAPQRAFAVADPTDVTCLVLSDIPASRQIGIRVTSLTHGSGSPDGNDGAEPAPTVAVYNSAGKPACFGSAEFMPCSVPGTTTDAVLVLYSDAPVSGRVGWYDLAASSGCLSEPSSAFGAPSARGWISPAGKLTCVSIASTAGTYRLAFGDVGAGTEFTGIVVDATGHQRCSLTLQGPATCTLPAASQPYRVLVYALERQGNATGAYRLHVWRLNAAQGCTLVDPVAGGFGPLVGTLHDPGYEACYDFNVAAGSAYDITAVNEVGGSPSPLVQVVRDNGVVLCMIQGPTTGHCALPYTARYTLLVINPQPPASFTGRYHITAACTANACAAARPHT